MKRNAILALGSGALISLGLLGGAATMASAERHGGTDQAEVQAFMAAKGSLVDAITAAEKQAGGKAMSVEFDNEQGAAMYVVELAKADGTTESVAVNPTDGSVMKIVGETEDHDEGGEENESN